MLAEAKKFLGFMSLGAQQQFQYRFNLFSDSVLQPILVVGIETVLWSAIFVLSDKSTFGTFSKEHYLSYFVWSAFVARVNSNWTYEHEMIYSIETGAVNSVIVRPTRFYDYYFGQFLGYKTLTAFPALVFPLSLCLLFDLPFHIERIPVILAIMFVFLLFIFNLSFCVACLAFRFTRVRAFTAAKNIAMWAFTGELFPLDLLPDGTRQVFERLPFASGVFVPVGYLTGRFGIELVFESLISLGIGILVTGLFSALMWRSGLRVYTGTGA